MSNSLLIIFPTQLFETKYIDKVLNYSDDSTNKSTKNFIIIWEHEHFFHEFPYHKMKLAFHRATSQCYFDKLKSSKYKVEYIESIEKNPEQKILGEIVGFSSNGPQDLLVVEANGKTVEIPFVDAFIKKIDFKHQSVVMELPEGLFK